MPPLSQVIGNVEREINTAVAAGEVIGPAAVQSVLAAMHLWSAEARELETQLAEQQSLNAKLRGASAMPQALETARFDNVTPIGGTR